MSNTAPDRSHWVDAAEDILLFTEGPKALAEAQKTMNDFAPQKTGAPQPGAATPFRRQLSRNAAMREDVLAYLRKGPDWWRDLLQAEYASKDGSKRKLLIAIRDGYMNAYADGQSVLLIEFSTTPCGVKPRCEIHHKYVDLPKTKSGYVVFDGKQILEPGGVPVMSYGGRAMMDEWISRALEHKGVEKVGVAIIAAQHANIIDVEMGLPANEVSEPEAKKVAPRMDIVALEEGQSGIRIVFYEAKHLSNGELRSKAWEPEVLQQLKKYETYVSDPSRREQIIAAYRETCALLCEIAQMRGVEAGSLIQKVAHNRDVTLDLDPKPRLIVFSDDEHRYSVPHWKPHEQVLLGSGYPLLIADKASEIQLGTASE